MIFTSLGLLLVAAGMLIAGIAKSSVALLMTSLLLTIASGVVLVMALAAARRLAGATAVTGAPGAPVVAGAPGQPVVLYVQQVPAPPGAPSQPQAGVDLSSVGESTPFIGYDVLTAKQITDLIESGTLSAEQLAAVREYELEHAARRTVLSRLDKMLASA